MADECQSCLRQQPRLDYCIDCWDMMGFKLKDAEARVKELEAAIGGMRSLIANSRGVDGYHLNDETATWEWLDQTGTVPEVFFHAPPETGEEGA